MARRPAPQAVNMGLTTEHNIQHMKRNIASLEKKNKKFTIPCGPGP
jgi:hypothetical protein